MNAYVLLVALVVGLVPVVSRHLAEVAVLTEILARVLRCCARVPALALLAGHQRAGLRQARDDAPPAVVRGEDAVDLRDQIRGWEGKHKRV